MTFEEIREIAINSAESYHNYLDRNNRGIQEVDVHEISYPTNTRDFIIKLRISAKLFDTEAIFFKNLRNNRQYDTSEVRIIEYDGDKNILLIKPIITIDKEFENLGREDLKVISDLKFLVQRVKTWYELNGASIHLPVSVSKFSDNFSKIQYFTEKELQPSDNQKESIKSIFTNPFSYVWGAPGTGKTQFVLSYAVLHYIKNLGKVAILAPTNNSIEQVLRGVIKMTDKAGIDRKDILRLGTPSKKFAEEFPEVCEEKGLQKKLAEIDKQIAILERIITYEQAITELNTIENSLTFFDDIPSLINKMNSEKSFLKFELSKQKKKEIDLNYTKEELNKLQKNKLIEVKKLDSFGHRFKKLFSSNPTNTETNIVRIEENIKSKYKEVEYLKYESSDINTSVAQKQRNCEIAHSAFDNQIEKIRQSVKDDSKFLFILKNIDAQNWESTKVQFREEIVKEKDIRQIDSHLFAEYKNIPIQQLQNELSDYLAVRTKLAAFSTEERLKTVKVVACTLDGYIGRYLETKLNVDHIFLDEAGYANIIKTLTLFNHNTPISFLGDHMQLPPVCEINDKEIQNTEAFRNMFLWAQSAIHLDIIFQNDRDYCLSRYLNNAPFQPEHIAKTSLNSTFRFGSNLAEILSRHVYDGNFSSLNPIGETQILFIHATKTEPKLSRISMNEVTAIKKITEVLKRNPDNDFVILTPYKKQIKFLNDHLPQERNDLRILTVHGSQGREWDTVILSVVDTFDKWFVDSTIPISKGLNLVNTAVSRAKKQLIIVCDKNYWINQDNQLITDLLKSGTEILSN